MIEIRLDNILFLDIENRSGSADYNELDSEMKGLWDIKPNTNEKTNIPRRFYDRAESGQNSEKMVCISVGYFL
jgi:hypothetical protein